MLHIESIFLISKDIICVLDEDGKFIRCNPEFHRVLAYKTEKLYNLDIRSIIHADDLTAFNKSYAKILSEQGHIFSFKTKIKSANGLYKSIQWHYGGNYNGEKWLFGTDQSELIRQKTLINLLNERITRQNTLLETALNNIPEMVAMVSNKLRFSYVNNTLADFFNATKDSLLGCELDEVNFQLSDTQQKRLSEQIKDVLKTGKRIEKRTTVKFNNKSHELYYYVFPIAMDNQEVNSVLFMCRDITEETHSNRELESSEQKLKQIIDLVPHPIFVKNNEGRYTLVNEAQAKLFNQTKDFIVGRHDSELFLEPEQMKGIVESDRRVTRYKEKVILPEQKLHIGDKEFVFQTIKIPLQLRKSDEINILGVSIDLTEIKNTEEELKRTNFELDSFVYRASHDLKAPLRSLIGLINLSMHEQDPEMRLQCLTMALKSIEKLDTFITDLTNFSRNYRLDVVNTEINIHTLIDDTFNNLRYLENADKLRLEVTTDLKKPFIGDITRMNIIFSNLISNAIKYHDFLKNDPYLKITVKADDKRYLISFKDNGIGIEKEYQTRIFDMFFRATENSFGSGLGLYIVQQTVQKMGGKIKLNSQKNEGSEFVITLNRHN